MQFTSDYFFQKMNEIQQAINQTVANHGALIGRLEQLKELGIEAAKAEEAAKSITEDAVNVINTAETVVNEVASAV